MKWIKVNLKIIIQSFIIFIRKNNKRLQGKF